MKHTLRVATRRATLGLAMAALAATLGCGGNGFGTSSLAQPSNRSRAAMDGFVFVPSRTRQDAQGDTSIPHALIQVFVLPRTEGDRPIAETQADGRGFYRVDGLTIDVPLLIIATDPFDPRRVLRGVISFREDEVEEPKERNLTPTSTLAAKVVERQIEQQGSQAAVPVSDAQVQALETIAEQKLAELAVEQPDIDVTLLIDTTVVEIVEQVVEEAVVESFGALLVRVFSSPVATATILLNGASVGQVQTALPSAAGSGVTSNELTLPSLSVGTAILTVRAPDFLSDEFTVDIRGGQTTEVERTLVQQPRPQQNLPASIVNASVRPQLLPFQGGSVAIQALVRDPDNDVVTGEAVVTTAGETPGSSVIFATVPLANNAGTLTGEVTVPGNPTSVTRTYTVTVNVRDSGTNTTVSRVLSFQVSGVAAPPEPPADSGARRMVGTWRETGIGSSPESLTPAIGTPDTLVIQGTGAFSFTGDSAAFSGVVRNVAVVDADSFTAELLVQSSTGANAPAVGSVIAAALRLTNDGEGLLTSLTHPSGSVSQSWLRSSTTTT